VAELAERQYGVADRAQLRRCGLNDGAIARWIAQGRLHRLHRGIYAVGHAAIHIRGRLVAAVLYGGPGAVLSHQTAAWCWGLLDAEPRRIHVTTPNRRRSVREIRIHRPRSIDRTVHAGIGLTTVPRTLLDLAATLPFADLRQALAQADHLNLLEARAVEAQLGRGRPGARELRRALSLHFPEVARTRSVLEERFVMLIERHGIPMPEVNVRLEGFVVDALWRRERVVVELDGHETHSYPAAAERDRRRDLILRRGGFTVLRYTWRQVTYEQGAVIGDLERSLGSSRQRGL
jgi:very-short-patch-repair endonuclease